MILKKCPAPNCDSESWTGLILHKTLAEWHWLKLPVSIFNLFNYFLVYVEHVSCILIFCPCKILPFYSGFEISAQVQ